MPQRVEPRILSGFMELLPEDQMAFNRMFDTIRRVYELFGFTPIETPAIELTEVLNAKSAGETGKQIYKVSHSVLSTTDASLHFDLTVPLARYVAEHYNNLTFPFRRYQMQKVWRGERPQKGRFREFYQCDIDVIGSFNVLIDAEIPSVIYQVFRELGFENFTIRINNRKILGGFFEQIGLTGRTPEILRIIDKLEKIGSETVVTELVALGLTQDQANAVLEFVTLEGNPDEIFDRLEKLPEQSELFISGVSELRQVVAAMRQFGVPDSNFTVDLTIARGLDYYTGTVYETVLDEYPGIGSVCSGGRYDDLAGFYTDKELPGVGISIGLTRLFYKLKEAGVIQTAAGTPSKVLVVKMTADALPRAFEVATALREQSIPTEVYFDDDKISKQLRYASKLGIPFVIIIGEEELSNGMVSLKNMMSTEQQQCTLEDAISIINTPQ